MRNLFAMMIAATLIVSPAFAQTVAPIVAGPGASARSAQVDADMAHHDRAQARHAARTGNPRRATAAAHAARSASNAAAVNSVNARMVPR